MNNSILYSGTVSCALEGAMAGYRAIAVSLASLSAEPEDFVVPAQVIAKLLPKIKEMDFPAKCILNINIPALEEDEIAGIAISTLGNKMFTDNYERRVDPRGKVYYWMAGELIRHGDNDDSDINALRWNKVSVTPITFEMTLDSVIPNLQNALCNEDISVWN